MERLLFIAFGAIGTALRCLTSGMAPLTLSCLGVAAGRLLLPGGT